MLRTLFQIPGIVNMAAGLRSQTQIEFVEQQTEKLLGAKLPTTRQVLCFLFFNLRTAGVHNVQQAAKICVKQVYSDFWSKTKIPCIVEHKAVAKLMMFHKQWEAVMKNRLRKTETQKNP